MPRLSTLFVSCFSWLGRKQSRHTVKRWNAPVFADPQMSSTIKQSFSTQTAVIINHEGLDTLEDSVEEVPNRSANAWRRRGGFWSLDAMPTVGLPAWNDMPSIPSTPMEGMDGNPFSTDDLTIITLLNARSPRSREALFTLLADRHLVVEEVCRYHSQFHDVFDLSLVTFLEALSGASRARFEELGKTTYLDNSLSYISQARKTCGTDDEPGVLARLYHAEALALSLRFRHSEDIHDIHGAVSSNHDAVRLTPEQSRERSTYLSGLGSSLWVRFGHLGELVDLEDAISAQREAVQLMQDAHPEKPGLLNELGASLLTRFEMLGELADMEDGITSHQQAAQLVA